MSTIEHYTFSKDTDNEVVPTTLISAAKVHEAKQRVRQLPPILEFDPLYTPLIEAANEIRQHLEEQAKIKINAIKRETADQTRDIYNKLTEAREEFKRLEASYHEKSKALNNRDQKLAELETQIKEIDSTKEKQHHELSTISNKHAEELKQLSVKSDNLIKKLKEKIEQINQDYHQQITNLQQKLSYQQQSLTSQVDLLTAENKKISDELTQLRENSASWQEEQITLRESNQELATENAKSSQIIKEKVEKISYLENSLRIANEELNRSQQYINELEEKNNSFQQELFENWIQKKDGLTD